MDISATWAQMSDGLIALGDFIPAQINWSPRAGPWNVLGISISLAVRD